MTRTLKIRELNDAFRRLQSGGGKLLLTQGIGAPPQADQIAILGKVANFDDFSEDNDPHGEHDFGAFEHAGDRIFWKIDYYGLTLARLRLRRSVRSRANDAGSDGHVSRRILAAMALAGHLLAGAFSCPRRPQSPGIRDFRYSVDVNHLLGQNPRSATQSRGAVIPEQ